MQLVDIGANLSHESFSHDFDEVIEAAEAVMIKHIVVTGTDLESSQAASQLARGRPGFFSCTAGYHPHVASQCNAENFKQISRLAAQEQSMAVGETGLDYNRNYSPRQDQLAAFERHLQLAVELQKPLFLHQRDAHADFLGLLKRYRSELTGGVVHCFTDTEAALQDYLELDMYIGITGWLCDERRGKELQSMVARIPSDRLLVETDAPYLLPRTLSEKPKNRRNEPKYLLEVVKTLAQCTGRSQEQVAMDTANNAIRLFKLPLSLEIQPADGAN